MRYVTVSDGWTYGTYCYPEHEPNPAPSTTTMATSATPARPTSFTGYMLRALYITLALCALFPLFIIAYISSSAFQSILIHLHVVNFPFPFLTDFTKPTEPQWLSPALPCVAYIHTTSNYTTPSTHHPTTPRPPLAGWLISPASRCPPTSTLSTHAPHTPTATTGSSVTSAADTRCSTTAPFSRPILYLHGNAENRAYRPTHARYGFLTGWPVCGDVFVWDYTGFGENAGWPTQELLVEDAHRMLESVNGWAGVDAGRVLVYGHSLGSAVAVQLLSSVTRGNDTRFSTRPPAGLILEGAFTNVLRQPCSAQVPANAMDTLPSPLSDIPFLHRLVQQYTAYPYKSDELFPLPGVPTLQLHGREDDTIRHWNAEQLWNRTVKSRGCRVEVDKSEAGEVRRCGSTDVLVSIKEATHTNSITFDIAQQAIVRFVRDIDSKSSGTI